MTLQQTLPQTSKGFSRWSSQKLPRFSQLSAALTAFPAPAPLPQLCVAVVEQRSHLGVLGQVLSSTASTTRFRTRFRSPGFGLVQPIWYVRSKRTCVASCIRLNLATLATCCIYRQTTCKQRVGKCSCPVVSKVSAASWPEAVLALTSARCSKRNPGLQRTQRRKKI